MAQIKDNNERTKRKKRGRKGEEGDPGREMDLLPKWHRTISTLESVAGRADATGTSVFEILQGLVKSHVNYAFYFMMYHYFCK